MRIKITFSSSTQYALDIVNSPYILEPVQTISVFIIVYLPIMYYVYFSACNLTPFAYRMYQAWAIFFVNLIAFSSMIEMT